MEDNINRLKEMLKESKNIVFFGGAGVSTESGIKDFRSKDGLYNMKYKYSPETILSHNFFENNTEEFFKFYKDKMNCLNAIPNITHNYLAKNNITVITQNIDGLHQKAGSKNVFELHGSVHRNYCTKCNKFYDCDYIFNSKELVPTCTCSGIIKPDVVLYGEPLNEEVIEGAINAIKKADMLIIGGTSLTVYPASSLIYYFKGKNLVLINKDVTPFDTNVNLLIQSSLGEVFNKL